jgi:hypothetical protein
MNGSTYLGMGFRLACLLFHSGPPRSNGMCLWLMAWLFFFCNGLCIGGSRCLCHAAGFALLPWFLNQGHEGGLALQAKQTPLWACACTCVVYINRHACMFKEGQRVLSDVSVFLGLGQPGKRVRREGGMQGCMCIRVSAGAAWLVAAITVQICLCCKFHVHRQV